MSSRCTFPAAAMTPQLFASKITMPNLTIQVRDDAWTKNPEDAQKTFDMLATKAKEMIWVENTTRLQGRLHLLRKISGKGARLLREVYEVAVFRFDTRLRRRGDTRGSLA
jgi:hypothetical protein